MQPDAPGIIATTVAEFLLPRLRRTHDRRRISVFSGPQGIGKTTSLEALRAEHEGQVAIVTVTGAQSPGGLKPTAALNLVIDAVQDLVGASWRERAPNGLYETQRRLYSLVCAWAGISATDVRRDGLIVSHFAPLTVIFDEAQHLSREAIELLRFANDAKAPFPPLPLGLVFVGNNEFVLKSGRQGQSFLSAAVADRALYIETLSFNDVKDGDLTLFFERRGIADSSALRMLVGFFNSGGILRSFRRAADLADDLIAQVNGDPITSERVREFLSAY